MNCRKERRGVLLMTYGSPENLDDVPGYMRNVYGGKDPDRELVAEFQRRYRLIGGSPLVQMTRDQAAALESELARRQPDGPTYLTGVGMRFFRPLVADGVRDLLGLGAESLTAIIMSPQYSPLLMRGYHAALQAALESLGRPLPVAIAGPWYDEPLFQEAIAERVREALSTLAPSERESTRVLLTAHSMPRRVVENEPEYIEQLQITARAVADRVNLSPSQWGFCYQSAGHTPEEWLKPDFADIMPDLAANGARHVVIAPVQFLADHLEILYDIEIGARAQAEEHGLGFIRTRSLNTSPLFISALADVVERTVRAARPSEPADTAGAASGAQT